MFLITTINYACFLQAYVYNLKCKAGHCHNKEGPLTQLSWQMLEFGNKNQLLVALRATFLHYIR